MLGIRCALASRGHNVLRGKEAAARVLTGQLPHVCSPVNCRTCEAAIDTDQVVFSFSNQTEPAAEALDVLSRPALATAILCSSKRLHVKCQRQQMVR
jgi:hypothetical protein